MLLFGWSLVEGLGAVMVIPAIAALIAANYEGKDRALAYGMLGGVAGAAIAAGPLIGGWVTTEFSWRYVFAGETVVVIVILLVRRAHEARAARGDAAEARLRRRGALGGRARADRVRDPARQRVGLDQAARRAHDQRHEITPLGFSVVPFLIARRARAPRAVRGVGGAARAARARTCCSTARCCGSCTLRAGLSTLLMQQLVLMGTFFVLPVYLQVVLGLDAFETGKRLFPLSVAMLIAALAGPRIAARLAPKRVCQAGLVALTIAAFVLVGTIDVELNDTGFAIALALFGVGAGLLLSQLGNVIMSSVDQSQEQRGRRAPGHGAEPRRLARHGADRRGAALGPHDRLHRADRDNPAVTPAARRPSRGTSRAGHRRRPGRRRRAGRARRGRPAGRGDRARRRTTATRSSRR